jgi:hypothetical protein
MMPNMPCTKFVLHDVEEEEKLFHLYHHCEKLPIAFDSSTQLLVLLSEEGKIYRFVKTATLPQSSSQK